MSDTDRKNANSDVTKSQIFILVLLTTIIFLCPDRILAEERTGIVHGLPGPFIDQLNIRDRDTEDTYRLAQGTSAVPLPRRPTTVAVLPIRRDNELLVLINDTEPQGLPTELAQTFQLELLDRYDTTVLTGSCIRYRVLGTRSVEDIIDALEQRNDVEMAYYNSLFHVQQHTPKRLNAQYALKKIRLPPAHVISKGDDVLIAVIDTGIDISHPDLVDNIAGKYNAVDNFDDYRADTHGTAIGGIISARGEIHGVAPMAKLLAVQAFYLKGKNAPQETSSFILIRGMEWAFKRGARIFNLSFAGPNDRILNKMINLIYKKGGILIAAAGNGGAKAKPAYPAAYRNVIAVTAIDYKDNLYKKANRGHYISVSAPGVDVLVTSPNRKYKFSSGTSLAAAHVSGLVALMREQDPDISGKKVRRIIMSTAFDLGRKGHDTQFGAGRVDANASLRRLRKSANIGK